MSEPALGRALKACERRAARVKAAEAALEKERAARDDAIRRAVAAGGSFRKVGTAAGVSHGRVQQLVGDS